MTKDERKRWLLRFIELPLRFDKSSRRIHDNVANITVFIDCDELTEANADALFEMLVAAFNEKYGKLAKEG